MSTLRTAVLMDRERCIVAQAVARRGCWQVPLHALKMQRGLVTNVRTVRTPSDGPWTAPRRGPFRCLAAWPDFDLALIGSGPTTPDLRLDVRARLEVGTAVRVVFSWPGPRGIVVHRSEAFVLAAGRHACVTPPGRTFAGRLRWSSRVVVVSLRPQEGMSGALVVNRFGRVVAHLTGHARGCAGYGVALAVPGVAAG